MFKKLIAFFVLFNNQSQKTLDESKTTQIEASPVVVSNYFQVLPNEIKQYIAFHIQTETDEQLLAQLSTESYEAHKDELETTTYTLFIRPSGNLCFFDKKDKKTLQLTDINIQLNASMLPNQQERITQFAVSPNRKKIVAIQSIYNKLGQTLSEIRHQILWIFNLEKGGITIDRKVLENLFNERTVTANTPAGMQKFIQAGYICRGTGSLPGNWILTKLFSQMAVSNTKLIALGDTNSIVLYDLKKEQSKTIKNFGWSKKQKCSLINGLEFNKQSTKLAVSYNDITNEDRHEKKEIVIPLGQPEQTLNFYEYFENKGICKSKQLE